ncbi:MAG: energy-coupling factor ABC transporter ATP-binding protein [Candidatus Sumerlaeaceae bacterium]|nr:energy-coupling factor ABC transporter ATP-binding protein [Candidatus Sumerlaeaceae bacterium]
MVAPLFDIRAATFCHSGRPPSLEGATLRVLGGERLLLLGANGAGKSTLLNLLGGLLNPTSGEVLFENRPLSLSELEHNSEFRREFRSRVGILFQNSDTQLFCPTVREEIAFGPLQFLSRDEALARTEKTLVTFDLEALASEPPYALSGGEKKRVALAATLVMEPEILLLDEPTANLDPRTRDFFLDALSEFNRTPGRTVITATHNLQIAPLLGSNCALLTPQHGIALHAPLEKVLENEDVLLQVNLVGRRMREQVSDRSH